jgi:hypothetical protein
LYHVQALRAKLSPEFVIMVVIPDIAELNDGLAVRSLEGWGERVKWVWGDPEQMALNVAQRPNAFDFLRMNRL